MPLIVALLVGIGKLLLWLLGYLLIKLLVLIGLSWVTYQGLDLILDHVKEHIIMLLGNSSDFIVTTLSILRIDVYISILLSSYSLKVTINGMNKATKIVWDHSI